MKLYLNISVALWIAVASLAVQAQQTGELTGTVQDSSGAVVPEASVTATNLATQQARTTNSNSTGNYTIPYLTPGVYTVKAEKAGFKTANQSNITLTVGQVLRMDFKMEVGQVTEQVEVTTAAPLLSTESTAVQSNVESTQIVALPLNGRDYLSLVALNPNVVTEVGNTSSGVGLAGTRASSLISIAGQRLEYNHYTLDGVENTEPNYNTYIIHPSVDALQEFTVMTGVYSAEFGRGAGQVNATTLPGGNTYHGTVFDFIRNDYVDARIWRQTQVKKNPFHRQNYGFVLDGPISIPRLFSGKDRLFFTSNFEALRDNQVLQEIDSVPTQNMRAGNFSDHMPGENPIFWPQSQVFTTGSQGACEIYSGNTNPALKPGSCDTTGTKDVIPSTLLSPVAKTLLNLWPLPNYANGAPAASNEETAFANDYVVEVPQITQSTQFNQRIDWTMNPKSILFGRYSWESDLAIPVSAFGNLTAQTTNTLVKQAVLGNTFTINQHMVNEARMAWDHFNNGTAGYYANGSFNPQASLGITGLTAVNPQDYGYPSVAPTGITGYGGIAPYFTNDNLYSYADGLTIIKGKQTIKVGGTFEADQFSELGQQFATGALSFNANGTDNPATGTANSGFGLADMEVGVVTGQYLRISSLANVELRRKTYAAFFQDDYKLFPNVTVNMGIRYDNIRPWYDKQNNFWNAQVSTTGVSIPATVPYTEPLATVVAGSASPIITRPGTTGCSFYAGVNQQLAEPGQPTQCGDQYMGRSTQNPNNKSFGPRLGLNWALGAKTSVRAGFGLFYAVDTGNYEFDLGRNLGGKDGTTTVPTGAPYIPLSAPWSLEAGSASCTANQYNGNVNWTGICVAAPQISAVRQGNRLPYVEQYILNVQRQITKNVAVEVAYTGNESHHVNRYFIINQAVPRTSATDLSSVASRRPWPSLGNIQMMSDWDRGAYNALDVKLTQHVSHGLLYVISFTWGHSIDFGSAIRGNAGDTLWPANSYNLRQERGNSQFNQPRRFVASFNYDLPFGKGRDFVPSNAIVNHVVSGWTFGGIFTMADGTSASVTSAGGDLSSIGVLSTWPQWQGISQYKASSPGVSQANPYWNKAAFACAYLKAPTTSTSTPSNYCPAFNAGQGPGYPNQAWQVGNWGRDNLTLPGLQTFDANLGRTFHIWESHTLLFRLEGFNALNRVNWGIPQSTNPSSATFGVINTTTTHMRELQAAVKYSF